MNGTGFEAMPPSRPFLRVLILVRPRELHLIMAPLESAGYKVRSTMTDSPESFRENLEAAEHDVILADYDLGQWTALDALEILRRTGKDVPLVIITRALRDEAAVECIKRGAADLVLKNRLFRLPAAVEHALQEKKLRVERKRAEELMHASEEHFRNFIENAPLGIYTTTPQGRILLANPTLLKMLGYENFEELASLNLEEQAFNPEYPRRAFRESIEREGEVKDLEARWKRRDGSVICVRESARAVRGDSGKVLYYEGIVEDITERKRAEEALSESQALMSAIVDSTSDMIWSVDSENFALLTFNRGLRDYFLQWCGILLQVGTGPEDHFATQDLVNRWRGLYQRALSEGPYTTEYNVTAGSSVLQLTFNLLKRDGKVYGISVFGKNITERKRAEEALRENEAALREAMLAAQMGVWEWTAVTDTVTWDENLYRIAGRDPKLPAPTYHEHPQIFTPESWQRLEAAVENALASGTPYELDLEMVRPDGSRRWLISRGEPRRDANGHLTWLRGTVQDITDRRRAEEALRQSEKRYKDFISHSHEGVWRVELEQPLPLGLPEDEAVEKLLQHGYIAECNYAFAHNMGFTNAEVVVGKSLRDLMHPSDQGRLESFRTSVRLGSESRTVEFKGLDKAGKMKHLLRTEIPIIEDGMLVRAWGITRDITEIKRAEEDRQHSLDQLRALAARLQSIREEERKRVAREIHDQLGQALTAIKIDISSRLRELPASEVQSKRTSSILQLVDESIRTVRRISTELRPGILDDLGLVAAIEWAGEDFQTRTGTKCRLDLPPEDIAVDPEQATAIFRIFQETLTNVARHACASKVEVRMAREGAHLTLEVHDNGRGLSEQKLSSQGSLGILGMRERALLLGGEFTIRGSPGNGTTVTIRIPEARHA